jgi:hypothetical protein
VSFLRGLLAARGHIAFLVGLTAAVLTVRAVDRWTRTRPARGSVSASSTSSAAFARDLPLRPQAPALDARARAMATAAWSYVERNTDPRTGLAGAVKGHPLTTMWDLGSQLMGILAAEDLGLVSPQGASERLGRAVASLRRLPLGEGGLPSKVYDVRTLAMVTWEGRPAPGGIGWSALDVARLLAPLSLVAWRHPELARGVRAAVSRWSLDALVEAGALRGASRRPDGVLVRHQEGRLGYEQLAAKVLLTWGLPAGSLLDYEAHATFADVAGEPLLRDDRRPSDHGGARAPVLSEPWILDGLENGFDPVTLPVARALLRAQARRFEETGRLTAVSEDHLDRPPWFTYSAVLDGDDTWSARAADGSPAPHDFTFSTKAAVAWGVLFEGPYPERLLDAAAALVVPGEGLLAGRYDETGAPNRALSLNTNAVVLEALAYRVRGPARAATLKAPSPAPLREAEEVRGRALGLPEAPEVRR